MYFHGQMCDIRFLSLFLAIVFWGWGISVWILCKEMVQHCPLYVVLDPFYDSLELGSSLIFHNKNNETAWYADKNIENIY